MSDNLVHKVYGRGAGKTMATLYLLIKQKVAAEALAASRLNSLNAWKAKAKEYRHQFFIEECAHNHTAQFTKEYHIGGDYGNTN